MAKPLVRLRVVEIGLAAGLVALVLRAAQVQLVEGHKYAAAARAQRTERVVLDARRGTLFDRHGLGLALTQETYHVGIAPNELRDPARDAATIARQLRLAPRDVERGLHRRYAWFAGPFTTADVQPLRTTRGVHLERAGTAFGQPPGGHAWSRGRPEGSVGPGVRIARPRDCRAGGGQ